MAKSVNSSANVRLQTLYIFRDTQTYCDKVNKDSSKAIQKRDHEPVVIETKKGVIEGILRTPGEQSKSVVIIAPGLPIGMYDSGRMEEIYQTLAKHLKFAGISTLIFNYWDVTPNLDKFNRVSLGSATRDLCTVVSHAGRAFDNIGIVGEGLGGMVAGEAFGKWSMPHRDKIKAVAFWYVPTKIPNVENLYVKIGKQPYSFTKVNRTGFKIRDKLIYDLRDFDPRVAFGSIECPVMILYGGADRLVGRVEAERLATYIRPEKKLVEVAGGDYAFKTPDGKDVVVEHVLTALTVTVDWFQKHLRS